jgi:hypothetical protein
MLTNHYWYRQIIAGINDPQKSSRKSTNNRFESEGEEEWLILTKNLMHPG